MAKKKMCPRWVKNDCRHFENGPHEGKCTMFFKTNDHCERLPSKKERVVKVKGWCDITEGISGHTWIKADNMVSNAGKRIKCTITYKLPKGEK